MERSKTRAGRPEENRENSKMGFIKKLFKGIACIIALPFMFIGIMFYTPYRRWQQSADLRKAGFKVEGNKVRSRRQ